MKLFDFFLKAFFVIAVPATVYQCLGDQPAERVFRFMDTFTDEERAAAYVEGRSHAMPHSFVDGQWQGIIAAGNGKTYFGVSCHAPDRNAQFYSYDPATDTVSHIIDVGKWCGETDTIGKLNTQGKIHSEIYEADGKLYMTTCAAHATLENPYPGGHFLSYDLETGECVSLARYDGDLLTALYEPVYERFYAMSRNALMYYDMNSRKIVEVGQVSESGMQTRRLIADRFGNVYGSTWGDRIYRYSPALEQISALLTLIPQDPVVEQPDRFNAGRVNPDTGLWESVVVPRSVAVTAWRNLVWDPVDEWWYGVRNHDEYLFRFRPPRDGRGHHGEIDHGRPHAVFQRRIADGAAAIFRLGTKKAGFAAGRRGADFRPHGGSDNGDAGKPGR